MHTPKPFAEKTFGSPKSATKMLDEQTLDTVRRIRQLAMCFPQYHNQPHSNGLTYNLTEQP
jgi:hypothetical protein